VPTGVLMLLRKTKSTALKPSMSEMIKNVVVPESNVRNKRRTVSILPTESNGLMMVMTVNLQLLLQLTQLQPTLRLDST
jgi:hypothetical protein